MSIIINKCPVIVSYLSKKICKYVKLFIMLASDVKQ